MRDKGREGPLDTEGEGGDLNREGQWLNREGWLPEWGRRGGQSRERGKEGRPPEQEWKDTLSFLNTDEGRPE